MAENKKQALSLLSPELMKRAVRKDRSIPAHSVGAGVRVVKELKFDQDSYIIARGFDSTAIVGVYLNEKINSTRLVATGEDAPARLNYGFLKDEGARTAITPQYIPAGSTLYVEFYNSTGGALTCLSAYQVLEIVPE